MKSPMTTTQFFGLFFAGALLCSCAANKTASSTDAAADDKVSIKKEDQNATEAGGVSSMNNNSMQLVDYLRRIPGLQIDQRGGQVSVMVRGMTSMSGSNSPLYVVNSTPVGNSYAEAVSAVDVNDIRNVNVIKGAEGQQMFGMRGANGVIQIFTKKK